MAACPLCKPLSAARRAGDFSCHAFSSKQTIRNPALSRIAITLLRQGLSRRIGYGLGGLPFLFLESYCDRNPSTAESVTNPKAIPSNE